LRGGEQAGLLGFRGTTGAVSFGTFAGDAVAVGPVLNGQIERAWGERKFVLGDGQAAAVSSHGGFSNG
jgi:hypothetical protein